MRMTSRNGEPSSRTAVRLWILVPVLALVIAAVLVPVRPFTGIHDWSTNAALGAGPTPGATAGDAAAVCPTPPRPFAEIAALADAPAGDLRLFQLGTPGPEIATPLPPTGGILADPDEIEAVTAALRELYACMNSGDLLRASALWTDEFLQLGFGGLDVDVLASMATPVTIPVSDQVTIVAVDDVRVLEDGRVTALVRSEDEQAIHVFVLEDGRYLLDGVVEIADDGTPVP